MKKDELSSKNGEAGEARTHIVQLSTIRLGNGAITTSCCASNIFIFLNVSSFRPMDLWTAH